MVEELISGHYNTTATLDASLALVAEERARLKTSLQEILVRNCSLRRKDFNTLMERIVSESEGVKRELEEERKHVRDELKGYLDEQKQLVANANGVTVNDPTDYNKFLQGTWRFQENHQWKTEAAKRLREEQKQENIRNLLILLSSNFPDVQ